MRADTVMAHVDSVDSTGCVQTGVILAASNEIANTIPPGGPVPLPIVAVEITQCNTCTASLVFAGVGASRDPSVID